MNTTSLVPRRNFMSGVIGAAAAAGLSFAGTRAAAQEPGADDWLKEVKGTHRCLFDFPQHKNGYPLLHILNYINTYATAYKAGAGQVGAVGTFYSGGHPVQHPAGIQRQHLGQRRARRGAPVSRTRPARRTRATSSTGRRRTTFIC